MIGRLGFFGSEINGHANFRVSLPNDGSKLVCRKYQHLIPVAKCIVMSLSDEEIEIAYLAAVGVLDTGDQEQELGVLILGRHGDNTTRSRRILGLIS